MFSWLSKPVRQFLLNIAVSLLVTGIVLLLTQNVIFEIPPLTNAELSLIDLRFRARGALPNTKKHSSVVIVEIHNQSSEALPEKWPWPIPYYTRMIRNLNRAGAKVIGIDILFEPTTQTDSREEQEFRNTIHEFNNVVFAGEVSSELVTHKNAGKQFEVTVFEQNPNYNNRFIDTTSQFGITNTPGDIDNVHRRCMPFVYDGNQEQRIPTFSMAVLNAYYHQPPLYTAEYIPGGFEYDGRTIPAYDNTSFLINYYGPTKTFTRIKFEDILDDSTFQTVDELTYGEPINSFDNSTGYLHDSTFADKIVLIGSTQAKDKDVFLTPTSGGTQKNEMMYGVELHANVIQSILDNNFIRRQPFWMTALVVFGLTLTTFVLTAGLKSIKSIYTALLGVAIIVSELFIIYWASLKLFTDENVLVDMTSPALAVIISYVGSTVYNYLAERKQKIMIKSMFSRYVNPTVVDELVAHPEKLTLGGERKELTVFFSDIENFTQISEKMAPEALVTVLNEYLSEMTALILLNNGTLDKYEGDAIVAFWGAPIPLENHALLACTTAVQMQEMIQGFQTVWLREGKPLFNTRIGINTGEVIVGNLGGASRFDYTVIGDSVNLGARLESANKLYRTHNMISERTYKIVKEHVFARELDVLIVAGKTEPIRVYELMGTVATGIPPEKERLLETYTNALRYYRQRDWDNAIRLFEKVLEHTPDDYPSQLYIDRSFLFKASPPPDDWNGVFILQTK
jgi:adenylate cyclase